MGDTKIEWTGKTWNPIRARNKATGKVGWFCEHVSEGCRNCYAEKMNVNTYFGNGLEYKPALLDQVELFLDEKILEQPLHWRKPTKVFPCSMTDAFARFVPDEWLDQMLAVAAETERHTYQFLTKRPERALAYFGDTALEDRLTDIWQTRGEDRDTWNLMLPLKNVWLGTSVEDQATADERIPLLLETPAAVRWVSAEPLIGPIDFWHDTEVGPLTFLRRYEFGSEIANGLDWVVVGGESGTNARSLDLNWLKSIINQCQSAGVPVFVKQLGYRPWWDGIGTGSPADHIYLEQSTRDGRAGWRFDCMQNRKGGDWNEWPEDLKVREFPA